MANGSRYDGDTTLSPGVFTTEQRRRLEAVTAGRALVGTGPGTTVGEWLRIAVYIIGGES